MSAGASTAWRSSGRSTTTAGCPRTLAWRSTPSSRHCWRGRTARWTAFGVKARDARLPTRTRQRQWAAATRTRTRRQRTRRRLTNPWPKRRRRGATAMAAYRRRPRHRSPPSHKRGRRGASNFAARRRASQPLPRCMSTCLGAEAPVWPRKPPGPVRKAMCVFAWMWMCRLRSRIVPPPCFVVVQSKAFHSWRCHSGAPPCGMECEAQISPTCAMVDAKRRASGC
mmetsp:Transcript_20050/g.59542  ORF Transcript_20050/g.59542 Transcript_20050/m.59542 type:complete len:225 (-) Transcript_20050:749-1423(-)